MGDVNENKTVFIFAVVNLEVLSVAVLKLGIEICTFQRSVSCIILLNEKKKSCLPSLFEMVSFWAVLCLLLLVQN